MSETSEFLAEAAPRARAPVVLPWMVALLSIVAVGVVAVYAKRLIDEQSARAFQATRMAEEYGARAAKLEAEQKEARRQAITASERSDETKASVGALGDQLKDKDSALQHLRDRHDRLVADIRAATRVKGKTALRRIDAALARDAAEDTPADPAATAQAPARRRRSR